MQYTHRQMQKSYAQWNKPSVTKPKPKNCTNYSSKCAYHSAQLSYTTQHWAVLIIFPNLQTSITAQILSIGGKGDSVVGNWDAVIEISKNWCENHTEHEYCMLLVITSESNRRVVFLCDWVFYVVWLHMDSQDGHKTICGGTRTLASGAAAPRAATLVEMDLHK